MKYAMITGASSGIGREFARQLARKGYSLILVARRGKRLEKLAQELVKYGCQTEIIVPELRRRPSRFAQRHCMFVSQTTIP